MANRLKSERPKQPVERTLLAKKSARNDFGQNIPTDQKPAYQNLIDSIAASIAILDKNGIITATNESWRRFARENNAREMASNQIGQNYLSACMSREGEKNESAALAKAGIVAILGGKQDSFTLEYPCHSPTKQRWFTMNASRLKGSRNGALVSHTDITERVLAEQSLRKSELEFRILAEALPQLVWSTRGDGWATYLNHRWTEYTGLSLEESCGSGWTKTLHPDDKQRTKEAWRKATECGAAYSLESRIRRADGVYRWWLIRGMPIIDAKGIVQKWFGTCTDIEQLKSAEFALRTSEDKFRNLVASANDGMLVIRHDSTIEIANPQIETMFGYSPGELVNANFELLVPHLKPPKRKWHRELSLATTSVKEMVTEIETLGVRRNGSQFPVSLTLSSFTANSERLVNCVIHDTSKIKEMENERRYLLERERLARQQAEEANRSKDEFLAILSHELRTPLTTILSWAQLLKRGILDPEKTKMGIATLEECAMVQRSLIDDLMDISRIQHGKLHLNIQEIEPGKFLSSAVDATRALAATKSIKIETSIDLRVNKLYADPLRMHQVMCNLLVNAIKFSPENTTVFVDLNRVESANGERAEIQVRDQGKGIKAEFLSAIFERFTQVDATSTRAYGGLGLGLAIVRKLVEMHEATITAASKGEGRGTTFTISLPLKPAFEVSPVAPDDEISLNDLRVMLVDDDENVRVVLAITLNSLGAKVKTAGSARAALQAIESFKPDVLVSDISMPHEDGYSLLAKVRALNSDTAKVAAVALTAYAGEADIKRAYLAGFQTHLAKPVNANNLAREIARLAKQK